ncbi:ATP-binding protein [Thermodesulfobacteriota bacterium]
MDSQSAVTRIVPHRDAIGDHVEILDYELAESLVEEADKFPPGTCSCRHKMEHSGGRDCDHPIGTCTSLGRGAEFLIRHSMTREISKGEMRAVLARSKELGLVLSADNVQKNITFMCHCCGCCCIILQGINLHGLTTSTLKSNFIASVDGEKCVGCKKCVSACPVNAVDMIPAPSDKPKRKKMARVDESVCLGCGVCHLKCKTGAISLGEREQRILHPETTFRRVILQCLERGTLQNQLFDNSESTTQEAMRYLVGAFLGLSPVKKALISRTLRSGFLSFMEAGVKMTGQGYMLEL